MTGQVSILGADGQPLQRPRVAALVGGGDRVPYDAASVTDEHFAAWNPFLWSPDGERNIYRDKIVSRIRDIARNDGWSSGLITRIVDSVIGGTYYPIPRPDYLGLAQVSGNKKFDYVWAREFTSFLKASWRSWADDPGFYCDAARQSIFRQLIWTAYRHNSIDGDAVALLLWLPERMGYGRAKYATAVQLIDPDRLCNPQLMYDRKYFRGGVEIDDYGAAVAYHLRKAHLGDWWAAGESVTWERVPRETPWGRPMVVHYFDVDRGGVHRGGPGLLAPIVQPARMMNRYRTAELDAAVLNAINAAFIESPADPEFLQEALGGGEGVGRYQEERKTYHDHNRTKVDGVQMNRLFPGEKIGMLNAERPSSNYAAFESAALRNLASGAGVYAQQASNDWSDTNYSSIQAALREFYKTEHRRRADFGIRFAQPIRLAHVEEAIARGDAPMPNGVIPEFPEARALYGRAEWIGPGRGMIDTVKEAQGSLLRMQSGMSNLERETAEIEGADYEERLYQRRAELDLYEELEMEPPPWLLGMTANQVAQAPEEPRAQ